jgi:hypothetical protein
MAYKRGDSKNIIVGAAAFFVADAPLATAYTAGTGGDNSYPAFASNASYKNTLADDLDFTNVGYTTNGLELMFEPDFGEVSVDQVLDVAKLYKQGMKVSMKTSFAEATLENLIVALAYNSANVLSGTKSSSNGQILELSAGNIGECPVERGLIAVGPGTGDCTVSDKVERVYIAYRALSIESVTLSAKRDEPTAFEVNFRLLPEDTSGSYGKMVDRTWT